MVRPALRTTRRLSTRRRVLVVALTVTRPSVTPHPDEKLRHNDDATWRSVCRRGRGGRMGRLAWFGFGGCVGTTFCAGMPWSPWFPVAIGLVACAVLLAGRGGRATAGILGLSFGAILSLGLTDGPRLRGAVAAQGVVIGAPVGPVADVILHRWGPLGEPSAPTTGRVRVRFPRGVSVAPGQAVAFAGEARQIRLHALPGAPDPWRSTALAGLHTEVVAWTARPLGGDPSPPRRQVPGLLRAIALGDRDDVDEEMLGLMRRTGTAHLLAISGSNVGLAALAGWAVGRAMLGVVAVVRPVGASPALPWLAFALAATAFTVGVGLPVSAQRALVAALITALARAVGRPLDGPGLVGLAALGVLLPDPAAVTSASFHLSFGAVIGLMTWGVRLDAAIPDTWPWPVTAPLRLLAASAGATVGTLPATAWWFQSVPPLGLVANLFCVPWSSFVLTPCAFVAIAGPDLLAEPAIAIGVWATEIQRHVLRLLDLPVWALAVGPLGAVALCALYALPRRPLLAAALLAIVSLPAPVPPVTTITALDVGQGDSLVVRYDDGRVWLIDGGWRGDDVVAWLRRTGLRHLDVVIASHSDADHARGLVPVLREVSVGELRIAGREGFDELIAAAEAVGVPVVDDPTARLHPPADAEGPSNERSQVLVLEAAGPRVLLPGDASTDVEEALVPALPDLDVLKVGHHGSRTSTSAALLDATTPSLALIPVGDRNRYGHPHPEVVRRLIDHHIPIVRTDLHGTVEVALHDDGPRWRTWRPGEGWSPWESSPVRSRGTAPAPAPHTPPGGRRRQHPAAPPPPRRSASRRPAPRGRPA